MRSELQRGPHGPSEAGRVGRLGRGRETRDTGRTFQAVPHVRGRLAVPLLLVPRHVVGDQLVITEEDAQALGPTGPGPPRACGLISPWEEDSRDRGSQRRGAHIPRWSCQGLHALPRGAAPTCPAQSRSPPAQPGGHHHPPSLGHETPHRREPQAGFGNIKGTLRAAP